MKHLKHELNLVMVDQNIWIHIAAIYCNFCFKESVLHCFIASHVALILLAKLPRYYCFCASALHCFTTGFSKFYFFASVLHYFGAWVYSYFNASLKHWSIDALIVCFDNSTRLCIFDALLLYFNDSWTVRISEAQKQRANASLTHCNFEALTHYEPTTTFLKPLT